MTILDKKSQSKTRQHKARQVKKNGEGFALFVALIFFNVDGEGWVVCGADFLCGQAAEPAAIILPQARDAAGIL